MQKSASSMSVKERTRALQRNNAKKESRSTRKCHRGVGKIAGEGNLAKDTPPKKGFWVGGCLLLLIFLCAPSLFFVFS